MSSAFHDLSFLDHENPVRFADGGEAVGDDDRGAALHEPLQGVLDEGLRRGVDRGRRLVQDEDVRVGGQGEEPRKGRRVAEPRADERALVDAILDGDRAALDRLHDRAAEPLYRFVFYRLGGSVPDAEEVVQETFLSALESLHRFEGRSTLQTWLQGIARHHIARRRRRRSRERVADLLESLDPEIDRILTDLAAGELPDEVLERAETEDLVGATMASLPPHYQDVLREKYVDALPVDEIARRRQATPKSVESTLGRAKGLLSAMREGLFMSPEERIAMRGRRRG